MVTKVLAATRLPVREWAPVRRKKAASRTLFGPPAPQSDLAAGLPADFDDISYRCIAAQARRTSRMPKPQQAQQVHCNIDVKILRSVETGLRPYR